VASRPIVSILYLKENPRRINNRKQGAARRGQFGEISPRETRIRDVGPKSEGKIALKEKRLEWPGVLGDEATVAHVRNADEGTEEGAKPNQASGKLR